MLYPRDRIEQKLCALERFVFRLYRNEDMVCGNQADVAEDAKTGGTVNQDEVVAGE